MSQDTQIKKQFIAGAKCPQCSAMDSLVFYYVDKNPVRECVDCDFKEELGEQEKGQSKTALNIKIKQL